MPGDFEDLKKIEGVGIRFRDADDSVEFIFRLRYFAFGFSFINKASSFANVPLLLDTKFIPL